MMRYLILILILTLSSCSSSNLSVYTDYVNYENLASYQVGTPDPLLNHPPFGQRLIVSWLIPRSYLQESPHLVLTIRYRNREQEEKIVDITKVRGTFFLCLLDEDYCEKGGILTYKVQLFCGDCLVEEWRHQLWAELIVFKQPSENESLEDLEESDNIDFIP